MSSHRLVLYRLPVVCREDDWKLLKLILQTPYVDCCASPSSSLELDVRVERGVAKYELVSRQTHLSP